MGRGMGRWEGERGDGEGKRQMGRGKGRWGVEGGGKGGGRGREGTTTSKNLAMGLPSVCPSVCHAPVLSLNGYTYPQKFFSASDSPTILLFPYQTRCQYSDGDPPNGGVECKGV